MLVARIVVIRTIKLVVAVMLSLATADAASAAPTSDDAPPARPDWCRTGFECVPTPWLAERAARVWELRAALARERAKVKRIGWTLGCGPSIAGVVTENFDAKALPALSCGVVYGARLAN